MKSFDCPQISLKILIFFSVLMSRYKSVEKNKSLTSKRNGPQKSERKHSDGLNMWKFYG